MGSVEEIKKDFMCKRSQMKGRIKAESYKSRWFLLTPSKLTYCDGRIETNVGKVKGQVDLSSITAIEELELEALGKSNAFQVQYKSNDKTNESYTLCVIAVQEKQRAEWIEALRSASHKSGAKFSATFHPGVWQNKKYSCCESINKRAPGCVPSENPYAVQEEEQQPADNASNGEANDKVLAIYDYKPTSKEELELVKGEEYDILGEYKENEWLKAKNQKGKVGLIPSSYVQLSNSDDLNQYDWYYKGVSRFQSETLIENDGREGCFMVRDSSQKGVYTLSIFSKASGPEGEVKHYHIRKTPDQMYYLTENHKCKTIPQLIYYHKHDCAGLVSRLKFPPEDKMNPTPFIGLHGVLEIDQNELEMKETLGAGQFGTVKKAVYRRQIEVAVKCLKEGSMSEHDFLEEAKIMVDLNHTNLVKLYGVSSKKKPLLIVTEFMKHGALYSFLRKNKHLMKRKCEQLLDICVQVCKAMEFLEAQKIIHRDLAARNCLVGESNVVKVADFGLSRHVLDDEYTSSTGSKFPVRWASPEILQYQKFTSKSDVWAFGVLMWEVFTCCDLPYEGVENKQIFRHVCELKMRPPIPEKCPRSVYEIMSKCWGEDTSDRSDFCELYETLREVMERDYVQ